MNVMPVLPGITDSPADLEALVRDAAAAGAASVAACALRLQHEARKRYLPFVEQEFPHLAERYRNAYASSHQVSARYREGLSTYVKRLCKKYGVGKWEYDDEDDAATPAAGDEQLALL